jgi:hypothetical protein
MGGGSKGYLGKGRDLGIISSRGLGLRLLGGRNWVTEV